jgi:hypothetical protein
MLIYVSLRPEWNSGSLHRVPSEFLPSLVALAKFMRLFGMTILLENWRYRAK